VSFAIETCRRRARRSKLIGLAGEARLDASTAAHKELAVLGAGQAASRSQQASMALRKSLSFCSGISRCP
jgi:hypothetical protein